MNLLLSFYADDFTGSTDVMDVLVRAGLRTVLFLSPPAPEDLARFPGVRAVGVAGMSRTWSPPEMEAELPTIFERLQALGAPLAHYKLCSTFDSSPDVGSIGRAIDIAQRVFASPFVPVIVGSPGLRRYTVFGNLFATVHGETFRIDRHPTMSRHPVTPMNEADLRLHLGRQTMKSIGLVDLLALAGAPADVDARLEAVLASGAEIVLFDVLDEPRMAEVGRLVWNVARASEPGRFFAAASSGLEYGLVAHWRRSGVLPAEPPALPKVAPVDRVAVVSGSCSPVTAAQISAALAAGFAGVEVDAARLLDPQLADGARAAAVRAAAAELSRGRSVVLHSARGPEDPRVRAAEAAWRRRNPSGPGPGRALGEELGRLARALLEAEPVGRLVLAGGDTSGHGTRRIGIDALEVTAQAETAAPLCRASSRDARVDGMEIVLKGGQVGREGFFESVRTGRF